MFGAIIVQIVLVTISVINSFEIHYCFLLYRIPELPSPKWSLFCGCESTQLHEWCPDVIYHDHNLSQAKQNCWQVTGLAQRHPTELKLQPFHGFWRFQLHGTNQEAKSEFERCQL